MCTMGVSCGWAEQRRVRGEAKRRGAQGSAAARASAEAIVATIRTRVPAGHVHDVSGRCEGTTSSQEGGAEGGDGKLALHARGRAGAPRLRRQLADVSWTRPEAAGDPPPSRLQRAERQQHGGAQGEERARRGGRVEAGLVAERGVRRCNPDGAAGPHRRLLAAAAVKRHRSRAAQQARIAAPGAASRRRRSKLRATSSPGRGCRAGRPACGELSFTALLHSRGACRGAPTSSAEEVSRKCLGSV